MNRHGIAIVLSSALALFILGVWRIERRRHGESEKKNKMPYMPIHTWEWEGGNVPSAPTPHPIVESDQSGTKVITH